MIGLNLLGLGVVSFCFLLAAVMGDFLGWCLFSSLRVGWRWGLDSGSSKSELKLASESLSMWIFERSVLAHIGISRHMLDGNLGGIELTATLFFWPMVAVPKSSKWEGVWL